MIFMRSRVPACCFLLMSAIAVFGAPSRDGAMSRQLSRYIASLETYFAPLHLLPILLASDQTPGDVLVWKTLTLEDYSSDCFPTLSPRRAPTDLYNISHQGNLDSSISTEIEALVGLVVGDSIEYSVAVSYTNAYILEASRNDFRRALDRDRCAYLESIVNEETLDEVPPFIVGKVLYAKLMATVTFERETEVNLAFENLLTWIKPLRYTATIPASFDSSSSRSSSIVIRSEEPIPVAFSPAFLVDAFNIVRGPNVDHIVPRSVAFVPDQHDELFRRNVAIFYEREQAIRAVLDRIEDR